MKTLKKTLCLVLAVVLALGVMVLPAYADKETYDNFTDKDTASAKYTEAVGALTGLGVINGRDNKLDPKSCITRAEAVTMLVRAILGKGAATLVKKDTKFADVTKAHYAAAYVQYAVENGIVAGKSDTEFKPDDPVTGYELARMALVAADIKSDFTSDAWQNQTGTAATKEGLLVGLENIADLNKALTREESAQLLWNTVRYAPDEVTLKVETVVENPTSGDPETTKYTVTYPEETIGGKVYNLKAEYNYEPDPHTATFEDAYGTPSVRWYNTETKESYYEGAVSAIHDFYVDQEKLTIGEIKTELNLKAAVVLSANVYTNGYSDTSTAYKVLGATTDKDADPVTSQNRDRGAHVIIFKAPYGTVKYFIYVNYTYAAFNKTATPTGQKAVANAANTNGDVTTAVSLGVAMGAKTVALFGITNYKTYHAVDVKVHAAALTGVKVVRRSNDTRDPYFYIGKSTADAVKTYVSAKAIYVDKKDNDIAPLHFSPLSEAEQKETINVNVGNKNYINVSDTDYYDVWFDNDGNVIAMVESTPDAAPETYRDFGYVLEFSSIKAASKPFDDLEYTNKVDAQAMVLMVNLKSGSVARYNLDVYKETDGTWWTRGIDGQKNIQITTTVESAIDTTYGQAVLHDFVAYEQNANGKYSMTHVEKLDEAKSTAQGFVIAKGFSTSSATPGRVTVDRPTKEDLILNVDADTEVRLLDTHTVVTLDKSRVDNYHVTTVYGYAGLKGITMNNSEYCVPSLYTVGHKQEIVGKNALVCYDKKTNMITAAYVFGMQDTADPTKSNEYWVFLYREDSVLGEGTKFHFLHDGDEVVYPAKQVVVNGMTLDLNNPDDIGKVCTDVEQGADGTLYVTDVTSEDWEDYIMTNLTGDVRAFTKKPDGKYFGYVDVLYPDHSSIYYLTESVMIVDLTKAKDKDGKWLDLSTVKAEDLIVDSVAPGDTVTVYNAYYKLFEGWPGINTGDQRYSLIVITAHK